MGKLHGYKDKYPVVSKSAKLLIHQRLQGMWL